MTSGAVPVPFFRRRITTPRAVAAFISALFFAVVLHLGLGSDIGSSLSTTLGAGDHAVLRHSVLLREGLRPVIAAEHGDRTSAPPPQLPAALVFAAVITAPVGVLRRFPAVADVVPARSWLGAHQPRAPPIAA